MNSSPSANDDPLGRGVDAIKSFEAQSPPLGLMSSSSLDHGSKAARMASTPLLGGSSVALGQCRPRVCNYDPLGTVANRLSTSDLSFEHDQV
ncbi:hypothetical protein TNCV_3836741 [Trichonephila clavipes]|nr:hypothetical protein TNCV_3836741 [Trichonephila clavipes]